MITVEDKAIKVGGVVLSGVLKSIEITRDAAIDDVNVEGAAVKPKQAVGYEEAGVRIDLIVGATSSQTAESKIGKINGLFRAKGQDIPKPMNIVCTETMLANINQVLFKTLTFKKDNNSDLFTVSLQFCEYTTPKIKVTATKANASKMAKTSNGAASTKSTPIYSQPSTSPPSMYNAPQLTNDYQSYLNGNRGTAPRILDKYLSSPVIDDRIPRGRPPE